jgi:DNA-directed RNA polymerases I, II, and III subunit RPABC4
MRHIHNLIFSSRATRGKNPSPPSKVPLTFKQPLLPIPPTKHAPEQRPEKTKHLRITKPHHRNLYALSTNLQTTKMSGYNPPSSSGNLNANASSGGITGVADDRARAVEYTCGDCDAPVSLKRGEPIRCRSCGHRVLYKQRTERYVGF